MRKYVNAYRYCAKEGSTHVWYKSGLYKLSLFNVAPHRMFGYNIDILVNRGSVNIAQTQINCAFAGMAGSATARVSGILINSRKKTSAPIYVLEVFVVIYSPPMLNKDVNLPYVYQCCLGSGPSYIVSDFKNQETL